MGSFTVDFLLDAANSGVLDRSVATVDCRGSAFCLLQRAMQGVQEPSARDGHTVEERIVGHPYSTTNDQQSSDASKDAFGWPAAARPAESSAPASELILDARPCFLGVRCRHVGRVRVRGNVGA